MNLKGVRMNLFCRSVLFATLAVLMAGCVSYHTQPMDRRVTVAPDFGSDVWVTDIRMAKGVSSHYTLQANVVNNTDDLLQMEYRVDWLDATGSAIPSVVSTWQPMSAAAREVVPLQAAAPSPDAVDFRFYVQPRRQ